MRLWSKPVVRVWPWEEEMQENGVRLHRCGLVPMFFYGFGLHRIGWLFDRKMPKGIRLI